LVEIQRILKDTIQEKDEQSTIEINGGLQKILSHMKETLILPYMSV
jgi:hypothetical protein